MADFNHNVWAPWRMEYIRSLEEQCQTQGCFLCHYWEHPQQDRTNHVLWRSGEILVVLNRFPYTNGHLLIAPGGHLDGLTALSDEQHLALSLALRDAIRVLTEAFKPQGFNVGYNIGKCAGAGLPGHVHAHVVPRWNADTNFMAVLGGVRVIPDALDQTYDHLARAAAKVGVAGVAGAASAASGAGGATEP